MVDVSSVSHPPTSPRPTPTAPTLSSSFRSRPSSLVVTLAGIEPGAGMDAAVRLADALDARRVPLTLLVGPRPHPEVAAWASARRRAGDAVLLAGTGGLGGSARSAARRPLVARARPYRGLPAHEAGLRLTAALRARDAAGLVVDGFAAPGWTVSRGVRDALVGARVDLLVDDAGVHRLETGGGIGASVRGPVLPASRGRETTSSGRAFRRSADLRHHAARVDAPTGAPVDALLDVVDRDLAAGAVPDTAPALLAPRRRAAGPDGSGDPELWSITA